MTARWSKIYVKPIITKYRVAHITFDTGSPGQGFTLLETIIVIILLSLLMTIILEALHFAVTIRTDVGHNSANHGQQLALEMFLQHQLANAYPERVLSANNNIAVFDGDQHSLKFLAPALRSFGDGLIDYEVSKTSGTPTRLTIRASGSDGTAPLSLITDALAPGLASINFHYYGLLPGGTDASWQDTWHMRSSLPEFISVQVTFPQGDGRHWPKMIVRLLIEAEAYCPIDPASHHCSDT